MEIPEEPNAPGDGKERFEQRLAELFELASRPDLHLTGAAAGDDLKVGELDLERDRAAANAGALALAPHLVGDFPQRIPRRFVGEEIDGKRVLGADGFTHPVGAYGPLVDAARRPVIIRAHSPEMVLKEALCLALKVESGLDTK